MGFYIGKIFVSYYGLMILIGVIVGFILSIPLLVKFNICIEDYLIFVSIISLTCMIGSKILYCIINYQETISIFKNFTIENIKLFTNSGFVFYGGLLLTLLVLVIIKNNQYIKIDKMLNVIFPIFVIVHGIGRIGCGLVGCCYGIEYNGLLSIRYENSLIAPNFVNLFPTQYVEAIFQIIVGFVFYILILKYGIKQKYIIQYLIIYSMFRFTIEYFRGDYMRGYFGILSISQVISLVFLIIMIYVLKKDIKLFT